MGIESDKAIIELDRVSFRYAELPESAPVLEDVSLTVVANDFLGIIGPNGGGKTTLLKIILGLLRPQQGRVHVLGGPPARTRHQIGYVPQHAQIDVSVPASVIDTVLQGRLARSSWGFRFGRRDYEKAREALAQTGIDHLADRSIRHLSGGQFHRVLIARALAGEAKLLLLDEPKSGMDPEADRELTELLHRLNTMLPIVLVSHDIAFVSAHLKRVACLNRRLTTHRADEVTSDVIGEIYHSHVKAIQHEDGCPTTYTETWKKTDQNDAAL